jgi:hypothetical protein
MGKKLLAARASATTAARTGGLPCPDRSDPGPAPLHLQFIS